MATNDLILYKKTEELLYKVYPKLVNYPKYERYALSQTIKNCFFSLLQNIALGVNAFGFKIYTTHKLLRNDSKKKVKRKMKKMKRLIIEGSLDKEKAEQIFNSWLGHASHSDSYNFIRKLDNKYDYIFIDNKGRIRVKEMIEC